MRHPKVDPWVEAARRCSYRRRRLTQEAEGPGAGDGLGPVGRAELAEDVTDMLLDRVQYHDELVGDLLVGPAHGQQLEDLQFAAAQRLDKPGTPGRVRGRPWPVRMDG